MAGVVGALGVSLVRVADVPVILKTERATGPTAQAAIAFALAKALEKEQAL